MTDRRRVPVTGRSAARFAPPLPTTDGVGLYTMPVGGGTPTPVLAGSTRPEAPGSDRELWLQAAETVPLQGRLLLGPALADAARQLTPQIDDVAATVEESETSREGRMGSFAMAVWSEMPLLVASRSADERGA